jgi:hypothetical protein
MDWESLLYRKHLALIGSLPIGRTVYVNKFGRPRENRDSARDACVPPCKKKRMHGVSIEMRLEY